MVATVVLTALGSVGLSSVFKDIPTYVAFCTSALPCLSVYIVTLTPDACHDSSKVLVKGLYILTGVVLGLIVHIVESYSSKSTYRTDFSVVVGTEFSGLWFFVVYYLLTMHS